MEKKWRGRVVAGAVAAALVLCGAAGGALWALSKSRQASAGAFFRQLGPGWNLGNSLDAHDAKLQTGDPAVYETYWGNPQASPSLFAAIRQAGFKTVRIPVTWYPHMDEAYQVDAVWMARVQQVVDDALAAGLHVILNAHHETWYAPFTVNLPDAEAQLAALWAQIAQQFADYGETLVFESMNEPRLIGTDQEWTGGTATARAGVNQLNQVFVDTVRSATGQNKKRYLLVPTYAASTYPDALREFVLPKDDRVGVSVHLYLPYHFTHEADGPSEWADGQEPGALPLDTILANLDRRFLQEGIPVVMTEYGAIDKHNTAVRVAWAIHFTQEAARYGIPCIWWDNGVSSVEGTLHTFALIDRNTLEWKFPEIVQVITAAKPQE